MNHEVDAGHDAYATYIAEVGIKELCADESVNLPAICCDGEQGSVRLRLDQLAVFLALVGRDAEHFGSLIESKRSIFHEVKY